MELKDEIRSYLRDHLSIKIEHHRGNSWEFPSIKVTLLLEDEPISVSEDTHPEYEEARNHCF